MAAEGEQNEKKPSPFTVTTEQLRERFSYHKPSPEGVERHQRLTDAFVQLAQIVNVVCPEGREKSLVFTKLEEAKMMASAAVARNPRTR